MATIQAELLLTSPAVPNGAVGLFLFLGARHISGSPKSFFASRVGSLPRQLP